MFSNNYGVNNVKYMVNSFGRHFSIVYDDYLNTAALSNNFVEVNLSLGMI